MTISIIEADLENEAHASAIISITNAYAKDIMGGGKPLSAQVRKTMISGMKSFPGTLVFLAKDEADFVGVANCFMGYSTFFAKPLINIHDLAVLPKARGKGVGTKLIEAVTKKAMELDCCKVTLEVLENNPARNLYEREGFEYGDPKYFFMSKYL
ncbi:MAG: GNAT family N-acetyltransferase [Balneolaceae bacterium]|nr:GNAT family N-acetyltransferase [Balneolaceae bacterium]MBO6545519.1 GNAT family N-acetyltransferase [Balneolaceae bacterium]MBO6646915.1 GNAT family N-acetyltransferase [Balneolaceae bacterium]